LTPDKRFDTFNYNIKDEESSDSLFLKRAGVGGSLAKWIHETHFGDAFLNEVGEAGVSPLGERGLYLY